MMKIVPARRRVTEASLEPSRDWPSRLASIDRRRASTPAGRVVAGGASMTATTGSPHAAGAAAEVLAINTSLRFGGLEPRFRSSQVIAATSDANFGIKRALAKYRFLVRL